MSVKHLILFSQNFFYTTRCFIYSKYKFWFKFGIYWWTKVFWGISWN